MPDQTPQITSQDGAGATLTPETSQDTELPKTPRRKKMNVGEQIVDFFEAMGVELSDAERAKLIACIDDKQMSKLIEAEMADCMKVNATEAKKIFGGLLMPKIEIPEMLMTYRFYTLWSAMQCVEFAKRLINGGDDVEMPVTYEQQIDGIRAWTEAVKAMNMLVLQAQKLAEKVGYMKKSKDKKPAKNAPPED